MSKSVKTIEDSLNIEAHDYLDQKSTDIVERVDTNLEVINDDHDQELDEDFVTVRNNINSLIESTKEDLQQIRLLAISSEDPKAWQAWTSALKVLVDLNNDLIALYEKRNKAKTKPEKPSKDENGDSSQQVTNNNLFVGSPKELNKLLKDLNNGDVDLNDITTTSDE